MKELWVKKTIWRRYLIEDNNIKAATQTLNNDERGEELVDDYYNVNEFVEYANEEVVMPIEFSLNEIYQDSGKIISTFC